MVKGVEDAEYDSKTNCEKYIEHLEANVKMYRENISKSGGQS
jgi:hypothetical protein